MEKLKALGISVIIQISDEEKSPLYPEQFEYYCFVFEDISDGNIAENLPLALKAIEKSHSEKKSVFIHCQGGVSRSASIVIAYIMKIRSWPY